MSTRYQRWASATRTDLFGKLEYVRVPKASLHPDRFPKLAIASQAAVFDEVKGVGSRLLGTTLVRTATKHFIFYQEATGYWVKVTAGIPYYAKNGVPGSPANGRFLYLNDHRSSLAACAILNSSLFYLYFVTYGDCFHLSDALVSTFPITRRMLGDPNLVALGEHLMDDLSGNAERKSITTHDGDVILYDEFLAWKSKDTIDKIDALLANHYGLSADQLDFIINYDVKYRMGVESSDQQN